MVNDRWDRNPRALGALVSTEKERRKEWNVERGHLFKKVEQVAACRTLAFR